MNSFPQWAQSRLASPSGQVSHGLNLVLKLDSTPNLLPLLLWDILLAQDKIKRALEQLSFVHYARFVPSWDGRALMVTTEFDGPLDPYVLDFVIALGDVFDTVLGYVAPNDRPTFPVREHPDEFLQWVRRWNRVPFYLREVPGTQFPENFDYPLYSAYPEKTVTDIAGPRQLPPPAVDHPAAAVDLADVQGNILRGYGARHGCYLLFSVANAAVARRWLAKELPDPAKPWRGVANAVPWGAVQPAVFTQVAITCEGLAKLLAPRRQKELEPFPTAFKEGAAARAWGNYDRGDSEPGKWLFGNADKPVHVVLFVYTREYVEPDTYKEAIKALKGGQAQGLKLLRTFTGEWGKDSKEPFGFTDGLSDPAIHGLCPARSHKPGPNPDPAFQPAASPGEFLLHKDYLSIYGGRSLGALPEDLASNGSFGVLRLMEQNVQKFKDSTASEAARLKVEVDLLRAKLVGRWEDGTPLALAPTRPIQPSPTNAFDYAPSWEFPDQDNDHAGLKCPVGAHVRRANPRTARVAGQPYSRRLLRRGMPSTWDDDTGQARQGLMGLFLGASIEQQFEFIQREWLQGDLAASGVRGTTDAISAIRTANTEFPFLVPDPKCEHAPPLRLVACIPPLVQTRGCLYLFFPGLGALARLDAEDSPVEDVKKAVKEATIAVAEVAKDTAKDVANQAAGAVGEVVGGVQQAATGALGGLGGLWGGVTQGVTNAIGKVAGVAPVVQSHLPNVDVTPFLNTVPELNVLRDLPALQDLLANGGWQNFISDLIERKLDSDWFRDTIDAFAPPHVDVPPPAGVHVAALDLTDPRVRAYPHDALRLLRNGGKHIVWVPAQQACWVLNHDDCAQLLSRHTQFVQTPQKPPPPPFKTPLGGIVTLDQPRHTVVSAAYKEAFRVALDRLEKKGADDKTAIERTADGVVQGLAGKVHQWQFDYMQDFAHPVARGVVWQLIGIADTAEQEACDALADTLVLHYGKTALAGGRQSVVAADAGLRLTARLARVLAQAWLISSMDKNKYAGTLIGELAARMGPGLDYPHKRPLGFIETLLTLVQTVLASQSPHFLLGSAALHLLLPDPRPGKGGVPPWVGLAKLAVDATRQTDFDAALGLALDEARRFEPPLALIERYARGPQEICGVKVPDGCAVFAMVASANRDTAKYPVGAEEFHADRGALGPPPSHLSLGHGIHLCAGRDLQARLVPTALAALMRKMPELRLSNAAARPAWNATIYFRSLQALSVTRGPC